MPKIKSQKESSVEVVTSIKLRRSYTDVGIVNNVEVLDDVQVKVETKKLPSPQRVAELENTVLRLSKEVQGLSDELAAIKKTFAKSLDDIKSRIKDMKFKSP